MAKDYHVQVFFGGSANGTTRSRQGSVWDVVKIPIVKELPPYARPDDPLDEPVVSSETYYLKAQFSDYCLYCAEGFPPEEAMVRILRHWVENR